MQTPSVSVTRYILEQQWDQASVISSWLLGQYVNWATMEAYRESEVLQLDPVDNLPQDCLGSCMGERIINRIHTARLLQLGPVDNPLAGFQKRIVQGVADPQQEHVREPSHHGGLQGVQSVMVDPVYDPLPSAKP